MAAFHDVDNIQFEARPSQTATSLHMRMTCVSARRAGVDFRLARRWVPLPATLFAAERRREAGAARQERAASQVRMLSNTHRLGEHRATRKALRCAQISLAGAKRGDFGARRRDFGASLIVEGTRLVVRSHQDRSIAFDRTVLGPLDRSSLC
eukprot:2375901-Pleurochrysis_carterae.AAC.1